MNIVGLHGITAYNDSMSPTIKEGDIMLVSPSSNIRDGGIYVVSVGGDELTKRIYKDLSIKNGGYIFKSDNSKVPQFPISNDRFNDDVFVIGEVVKILSIKDIKVG